MSRARLAPSECGPDPPYKLFPPPTGSTNINTMNYDQALRDAVEMTWEFCTNLS